MPISGDTYSWNEDNVNKVPAEPGVYALLDAEGIIIYIGKSENLRHLASESKISTFSLQFFLPFYFPILILPFLYPMRY